MHWINRYYYTTYNILRVGHQRQRECVPLEKAARLKTKATHVFLKFAYALFHFCTLWKHLGALQGHPMASRELLPARSLWPVTAETDD
jgi:hypothetical protein